MDLIEKERNEYEQNLESILKENKLRNLRKLGALVPAVFMGKFLGENLQSIPIGAISGWGFYEFFSRTINFKNKSALMHPTNICETFRNAYKSFSLRNSLEDDLEMTEKFLKFLPKNYILEKKIAETELKTSGGECIEDILEILDYSEEYSPHLNFLEKIIFKKYSKLMLKKLKEKEQICPAQIINSALEAYLERCLDESENLLRLNIERGTNDEDILNSACILGQILENENKEGSEEVFRTAIEKVKTTKKNTLKNSSNEIYLSNSNLANRLFIFKTGKNPKEIIEDYEKTEFIYSFFEDSKNKFVRPLKLLNVEGEIFSITKNAGNFNLKDYLDLKHYEEGKEIIKTSLENLLLLQLKSNKYISGAMNLFDKQNFKRDLDKRYSDALVERLNFLFIDSRDCWKGIVHGDLHPGNIVLNRKGASCIIDFEKSKIGLPYMDSITLIDNYSCLNVFEGFEERKNQLTSYCENAFDSGVVDSFEKSMKYGHILGILENLRLCSLSEKFAGKELELAKKHHMEGCKSHFEELEDIYEGENLKKLRDLGNYLFGGR